MPELLQDADAERLQEVTLARANFVSELLKAGYLMNSIDAGTYKGERDEAFRVPELNLEKSFPALVANANSLVEYNSALGNGNSSNDGTHAASRWSALSAAISNMTTASKLSDPLPDDIAETHFVRGNCSLLQYQLGQPPILHSSAAANGFQLLKNADTFYHNARKLYQGSEQKATAEFRAVVVESIQQGTLIASSIIQHDQGRGRDWAKAQIDDMVDDGLVPPLPL